MQYFYDFICPLLCFVFCFINSLFEFIRSKKLNKKIVSICEKCDAPLYANNSHECKKLTELSSEEPVKKSIEEPAKEITYDQFISSLLSILNGGR